MKRINLLILQLLLLGTVAFGQPNFFTSVQSGALPQARESAKPISRKGVFRLNEQGMRTYLLSARMEFRNNGITLPLQVPLPDGTTEIFNMVESPVLSPAVAAANPSIKTYTGNGTRDKKSVIRISLTSAGFSAVILNVGGDAVYFESYSKESPGVYFNYFAKDATMPAGKRTGGRCGVDDSQTGKKSSLNKGGSAQKNSGAILRTFRIAVAANGEFTAAHGGTQASAFATVVNYVNNLTAVYRNELSVSFVLVSGTNIIYTDPATDPYDNSSQSAMLAQNQANLDMVIGSANYDIGHVWGKELGSGGGVASLEAVCDATLKGRGMSGEGDGSYAQVFNDQLFFHEVGHQFGMTHSYNSSIPVCTTRSPATSVEPGAGATIMSYGFTCDSDDYFSSTTTGPILNFHTVNYDQAEAYMNNPNPGYGNCYVATATGNQPPVVTVPGAYTIPKSTPFALTGSATDANNDALTYSWEGTNVGTMVPDETTLANTAQPPFFRSYEPVTSPIRIYPRLSAILDGSNNAKGDKLPSVSIATTHRLTVRDNNAAGGGVNYGSVTVTINGNIGPFLVTSNLSDSYKGLTTRTVTWSVNGTQAATPNVKISLSTDGGYTFPTVLAASTPNDGSEAVTLPNTSTTTARIKVEAVGNIFFDISNSDFTITPADATTYTITAKADKNGTIAPEGKVTVAQGANQTFTITPNAGYLIEDVKIDGKTSVGPVSSYTFINVVEDHKIDASFKCPPITLSAVVTNITCNGQLTGAIDLTVSNGIAPFTYAWTSKGGYTSSSQDISGLGAGKYSIKVSQANGCKAESSFEVTEPDKLAVNNVTSENVSCFGLNDGSIKLKAKGGTPPYYATVDNAHYYYLTDDTITFYDLAPGTYTPALFDANNCSVVSGKVVITQPASLNVTLCYTASSATLHVVGKGGTEPYEYSIDGIDFKKGKGKDKGYDFDVSPGVYTVYLRDKNDCVFMKTGNTSELSSCNASKAANANNDLHTEAVVSNDLGAAKLHVTVMPNPSGNYFTLRLSSQSTKPVQINVLDGKGRLLLVKKGSVSDAYRFGEKFAAGIYILEVIQGTERKTFKLVKQ